MTDRDRLISSPFFLRKKRNQELRQRKVESQRTDHERLSRLIKNIFYLYIFANLFCLITLYTVSDEEVIRANARILIPVLNVQVPYVFFVASGSMVVFSLFVYLSIRFEELDKIVAKTKMPYIFNSDQRATRQLTSFILYFLGPITILTFTEQAYLFRELDRMPAAFVFFVILILLTYKKRSTHHLWLGGGILISIGIFIYTLTSPIPFQMLPNRVDLGSENLKRIQLSGYRLHKALFNHAQLYEAGIRDSEFNAAEFWGANFSRASIYNCNFIESNMEYADFSKTILRDVTFKGSNLKQTDFSDAILFNVKFAESSNGVSEQGMPTPNQLTNLGYARFAGSKLVAVDFDGANLSNAEFINSDIQNGSFKNTILNGVDFQTTTGLTCEQLRDSKSHMGIKLPFNLLDCFDMTPAKDASRGKTKASKSKKTK